MADPWTNFSSVENKGKNTQVQPPSKQPPPAHTTYKHPCLTPIKTVVPRGSYGNNMGDPWTNSSGKDPDDPLDKTQAQKKTTPPLNTQAVIPRPTDKTIPIASKDLGPRGNFGQNMADPWTNASVEV